jgi:hypothetical protein
MEKGLLSNGTYRIKGLKAFSIGMKENDLSVEMKDRKGSKTTLVFQGVIGFSDSGMVGKSLSESRIEDKGSFKKLSLYRANGILLFTCDFMEGMAV